MSYSIQYNSGNNNRYPEKYAKYRKKRPILTLALVALCLVCVLQFDIAGLGSRWFTALDSLAQDIRQGTPFGQTVTACMEQLTTVND